MSWINEKLYWARYWILWAGILLLLWQGFDVNLRDAGILAMSPFVVLIAYHTRAIRDKPFVREMHVDIPDVHLNAESRDLLERICNQLEEKQGGER